MYLGEGKVFPLILISEVFQTYAKFWLFMKKKFFQGRWGVPNAILVQLRFYLVLFVPVGAKLCSRRKLHRNINGRYIANSNNRGSRCISMDRRSQWLLGAWDRDAKSKGASKVQGHLNPAPCDTMVREQWKDLLLRLSEYNRGGTSLRSNDPYLSIPWVNVKIQTQNRIIMREIKRNGSYNEFCFLRHILWILDMRNILLNQNVILEIRFSILISVWMIFNLKLFRVRLKYASLTLNYHLNIRS